MSFSQVADLLTTTPTAQKMDFIKDVSLSVFDHFENDVSRHISEHLILSKRLYVNPFQSSDAFHIETSHLYRNQSFVLQSKTNDWFLCETLH